MCEECARAALGTIVCAYCGSPRIILASRAPSVVNYANLRSSLIEEGRRLASEREDLLIAGISSKDLDVPQHPDDL
jgi:hypothetical protein